MLQPRSCRIACLLLVFLMTGLADDQPQDDEIKERVKRENGDVTVLSLEEIVRLREAPVGVLSSTARTFVTGGATTEFATQILGTTVGRTYAKLLSTGSRVYYDNAKPTKDPNPFLVFPSTLPIFLNPTTVTSDQNPVRPTIVPKFEYDDPMTILPINNEIIDVPEKYSTPSIPVVSVRKEFSVKRNSEVKPAKVKPNADLPTVTIKAEFAPSGYSETIDERRDKKLRAAKGLFRGGVQIKNEFQKYDTVTYVGFADFTTTVGNTVIVFMPKTAAINSGPVTSIAGAATLRPEDAVAPVVTTVKTFLSHSPAMATKTVTGHNLNVQTALPTVQADTRASKAYNPVYLTTEDSDENTEKNTTPLKFDVTERLPTTEEVFTTDRSTSAQIEADVKATESENLKKEEPTTEKTVVETESSRKELPTTEEVPLTTEVEELTTPEGSEVQIPHEDVQSTESLKVTPTFITSSTKIFIPGDKPLGLAKSIAAIEAYDETTTFYTSFLFGTIVDGDYTQLTQVVSSVSTPSSIIPTPVVSDTLPSSDLPVTSETPITESAETTTDEGADGVEEPESLATKLVTKLVPTTVHQTYTYLTTFFVPQDDTTTTSVRTREVVSDEIRYIATVVPENFEMPTSEIIMSSEVTQNYMTTTPFQESRTEEVTEQSTPPLLDSSISAVTQEISPKTEETVTTEATSEEPDLKKFNQSTPKEDEEEVEVIIRTLYTTYTYLTTFFQESTTSVQSREVVETNVVTSTLDSSAIPEATDPAVAGLFSPSSVSVEPLVSSEVLSNVVERPPSDESFFKTYTYYTTVFVDGETIIESRTEVVKETIQPTVVSTQVFKTASYEDNSIIPKKPLRGAGINQRKRPSYGTISRPKAPESPSSEALIMPHSIQSSIDDAYSYDTTMSPIDRVSSTLTMEDPDEAEMLQAREDELKKEAMLAIGMTTTDDSELVETMVTDITSSSSGGNRRKSFDEYESDPNDQISSESNTEEIEPSFSPTVTLQSSYTTFTYFTTVYKGTSSDIVSRLETVTNVVTETVKPTEIEPKLSPEEATLPITYFTTFTYWTTLYKGKSTMITSREETVSNIVTPTLESELNSQIEMTESPSSPTKSIDQIVPTVIADGSTSTTTTAPFDIITLSRESHQPSGEISEISPTEVTLDPTTYYTTYTYFTTSYIDNETVINSHLETETNIETPTTSSVVATEIVSSSLAETDEASPVSTLGTTHPPVGLISTIRSSNVNEGVTTLLHTDIYGTYIDGLYAQVLESSSEIIAPSPIQSTQALQSTGIVSINEGKIVDANGITTTLFTTKAIGTYIDALYAQVLESTSSVFVDEAKQTGSPLDESTTVVGTKVYTTGLVRLIEGSIVKDLTTTFYESRVIGTLIDGRYAQIIESTSSFKAATSTSDALSPTSTLPPASGISPTTSLTTSSPAVLEGSQPREDEEEEEEKDEDDSDNGKSRFQGKKKTFTPVIRPFSSRPRPTFQPKKKTGDPATTITRTSFTPTVTATPASKTGFGSSRNRFAANRSKASTNSLEIKPTASSSRRFSRPRSSSAPSFGGGSSSRGRSSSRVQPSVSSSIPRRGGFSYRSTGRPNLIIPSSSRARIRPTGVINRFASSQPVDDINNNDITGNAVTEEVEHNTASNEEEEEQELATSSPTTTTESSRRAGNPLLRFRRPPILQRSASTTTTTPKPSTTSKRTPSLLRRPDSRSGVSVTTTPRSRPTVSFNRLKPRPASSLFPPRGLAKKPVQEEPEEEEKGEQPDNEENIEDEIEDNEYEGSETAEQTSSTTSETPATNRRAKGLSPVVQIRPFTRRPRNRRQADFGNKYSARYRRPSPRSYEVEDERTPEPVSEAPRQQYSRSYNGRSRNIPQQLREYSREPPTSSPRVRPSPVPSTPRHQFTLRERASQQTTTNAPRSNFRRPTTSSRRRPATELTTQSQRLSRPVTRQRTATTEAPTSHSRGTSRRYNTHPQSRRTTARARYRDSNEFDTYSPKPFDGTITVTHKVPTEVTIPIVNGKNTEYKPIITAKPSLEVLNPFQYTNIIGKDGKSTIILNSDLTSTLPNGIMEVTKFLVFETPTTSVTFTPTTLRGRKTSFSHIIPSTVYEVRPEVSTIQPNLGDNPLANILLSQLLLGNLGQPTIPGQPQTPVTEYKTKTTTYVTTVTSHTSTILPLTFRGKEITTTIVDSSTQVITATEYLTETVVITPTAVIQPALNNQLNTLLLPALLQAQLLNKPTPNPVQWPGQQKPPTDDLYNNDRFQESDDLTDKFNRQKEDEEEDRKVRESIENNEQKVEHKPLRKKSKIKLKEKDKDTGSTIVTLYVSGKHPGEFTTLLSTVPVGSEGTGGVRKREIDSAAYHANTFKIQASKTPELGSSFIEEISNFIAPVSDVFTIDSSEVETLSIESDISDIGRYLDVSKSIQPEIVTRMGDDASTATGHFLLLGHADSAPDQRKATSGSSSFLARTKRETEARKVIKIRVPIKRKRISSENDFYEGAASSQDEEVTGIVENTSTTEPSDRKVKRILVARRKPQAEPKRKRILITRRKQNLDPSTTLTDFDDYGDFPSQNIETLSPTTVPRRVVLKTKKRLITSDVPYVEGTEGLHKRRVIVTKRRPVQKESDKGDNMRTLYNYQYSIPSDEAGHSVRVSEIFMTGLDSSRLPAEIESDSSFMELMENSEQPRDDYDVPTQEEILDDREKEGLNTEQKVEPKERPVDTSSTTETIHEAILEEQEMTESPNLNENPEKDVDDQISMINLKLPNTQQEIHQTLTDTEDEAHSHIENVEAEKEPEYYYEENYEHEVVPDGEEEYSIDVEENTRVENEEFELDSSYVTIFPYETTTDSLALESLPSLDPSSEAAPTSTSSLHPELSTTLTTNPTSISDLPITTSTSTPLMDTTPLLPAVLDVSTSLPIESSTDSSVTETPPIETTHSTITDITTEYQTVIKTLTTTRDRTFTYVVTRVSGDEQYVTSSTTVKPFVKTTTVTEIVPFTSTQTVGASSIGGRGLFVIEPRHNLATKVMANGVEVIVAGDKSTLPGSPLLKVIPTGLAKPITLAPSTLTDHMMMVLPHETQKPQNEFVTKTYMTTYTYLTTFAEGGSTVVSSREKVVHNKVTEEVNPSSTKALDHITLSNSPSLTTGVYHTTYTYLNTLVDGEQPLVVTSKKTVANTKVEQLLSTQPSAQPQTTNTYVSTVAYTRTVNDGDRTKLVQTEDLLTQVVITESDYLPSSVPVNIRPTPITTDLTKTYFATYTYFNTQVVDGSKVVKTEVLTSSDVVTETFTIQPKKTSTEHIDNEPSTVLKEPEPTNSINLYATKTYLTTFTYFTTLLQDNSSPSTIVKSRTKVQQNIVTETIDGGLIDPDYLNILKSSVSDNENPIVATAALNNGNKMEVTAVASRLVSASQNFEVDSSYLETPSNVVTGSTIIFFDDDVQSTPTLETSFYDAGGDHTAEVTSTPSLISSTPVRAPSNTKTKLTSPEDGDESMLVEMAVDPSASSGGSSPVNNIFNGLSALGPVINAMADLFQNNVGSSKRKNQTQTKVNAPQAFAYVRPLESINKDSHNNHPSPVYIPAPEPLDSEVAESQNIGGLNGYDINQRTPGVERPSIEAALLSGGIPISPGQVIRTNSDVIIGKHSAHGPRPPNKPFKKNDVVEGMKPPPPPNYSLSSSSHPGSLAHGQPSTKPIVNIPAKTGGQGKPSWPTRDQDRYPSILVPQRVSPAINHDATPLVPPPLRPQHGSQQKQPPKHVSLEQGLGDQKYSMQIDPPKDSYVKPHKYFKNPPLPRPNEPIRKEHIDGPYNYDQRPAYVFEKPRNPPPRPLVQVNREDIHNEDRSPHLNMSLIQNVNYAISHDTFSTTPANEHGLLVNIQPSQVANVVIPHEVSTALIYSGVSNVPSQKGEIFNEPSPYPDAEVGMVGVAGLSTSNGESAHIPSDAVRLDVPVSPQVVDIQSFKRRPPINSYKVRPERPNIPNVLFGESSVDQRPLVDIQSFKRLPPTNSNRIRPELPNVPPTNLLLGQTPSVSSHFEFNKRPKPTIPNWIRPESPNVPSPNVLLDHSPGISSQVDPSNVRRPTYPNRVRPGLPDVPPTNVLLEQSSNLEYMTPPSSLHPISQISSYVNYHLPKEQLEDQEGDYSVNNEYHTDSDEAQNVHSNNKNRPIWGTKVSSGFVLPNAPRPFNPYVNYTGEQDSGNVQYSVINSKPVVLSYDSTEKQPPIVKGKPGVTTFDNKDEATLSVGLPTKLAPADESAVVSTASNKQDDSIVTSFDYPRDKPQGNRVNKPSIDNIKSAMNIDEKPPPPTNETPVLYDVQSTIESSIAAVGSGIGVDRNPEEEVLGLTPPALGSKHPPIERSTHRPSSLTERVPFRPSFATRRPGPIRKRPPPPYKFEIPLSTASTKVKKPNFSEIIKPQDVPAEALSPPPKNPYYPREEENVNLNPLVEPDSQATSVSINPVLGGSLKVEELPRKPEVITADVKVPMDGNVITSNNYQTARPQNVNNAPIVLVNHQDDGFSTGPNLLHGMPLTLEDNKLPIYEGHSHSYKGIETKKPNSTDDDTHVFFGMKIPVVDTHPGSGQQNEASHVNLFTVTGSTDEWDTVIESKPNTFNEVTPQPTQLYSPTPTPTSSFKPELDHIIVGSETAYGPDNSVKFATQPIDDRSKFRYKQASTSNLIQVTTRTSQQSYLTPVRSVEDGHSVIPLQLKNRTSWEYETNDLANKDVQVKPLPSIKPTTYVVTHTQTLTVTMTESRIVQSKGQKPSTHTLVVTKTHTSTILDTVTEIHTLVKPTNIVQTVTTTIPQATTTIFPTPTLAHGNVVPTVDIIQHFPTKLETVTPEEPDTILVVMSDKNSKDTLPQLNIDPNLPPLEIEGVPEENEVQPNVQLGSFHSRHPTDNECKPECKASRNERCQKINGIMRCVCRPGFARMFAERPCKPTYTFSMQVPLERVGKEKIRFSNSLMDSSSGAYQTLAEATKEGLDRMVMQSDLRDVYHGLQITGFNKNSNQNDTLAKFYIQLSENTDESKLVEIFTNHLKTNNFTMGGTDLHASEGVEYLRADDFDECKDTKFHDCSENAQCFNLKGTYTCSCKEGFTDLSHNTIFPGRICSAEMIGCERCNFHGNCFTRESEEDLCECFQWYAGQYCQINMKVLLLILSLVGVSLVVLLIVCLVLSCMRRKPLMKRGLTPGQLRPPGFRLRPQQPQDKRAMISMDTSSEASMEPSPPPYIKQASSLHSQQARPQKPCRKQSKAPSPPLSYHGTMEQRDRSLTVMIPRAKYRPVPVQGSNLTMSTFGPEQKLLKYLTVEKPSQNSRNNSRKPSNSTTNSQEATITKKLSQTQAPPRKPSTGALVSAGFEVSATVGRTKEIQECFISEPHTDLNQEGGFSTIRTNDSSVLVDVPPPPTFEAELLDSSQVDLLTVSEARSYDETLIHPPTKCLRSAYDRNDESHTMGERDTGSTFVLPQSQLYKPERGEGSDISNFDSL